MSYKRNFIIVILLIVILAMAVGYSSFSSHLSFNGIAEITSEWNVKIADIKAIDYTEGADGGKPQYTNTTASFNAKLSMPGDYVIYEITIENAGTIDAILNTLIFKEENGPEAIKYSTTECANILKAGETTTFNLTVEYSSETTENPTEKTKTITGIIEYVQM